MSKFKNIVVKIGSSTLTNKNGNLDTANLKRIAGELAELIRSKKKITVVTSGAIVSGSDRLKFNKKPRSIPEKQAAAAVGQSLLMMEYSKAFGEHGLTVAQILLTRDEVSDRQRYLNTRNTISKLLEMGVVPIVNENDTVSVEEIKIGDNDTLSALVASLIGADLLVMLTDVDGFMMPDEDGELQVVHEIKEITQEVKDAAGHPSTQMGVGGMITKIQAAEICSDAGVEAAIANGRTPGVLDKIIAGGKVGTIFKSKISHLESRKRWLAHGLKVKGTLVIDGGAETALIKGNKSLLPVGIREIAGKFDLGEAVSVKNESGLEVARGLVNYSSENLKKITGLRSDKISEVLGIEYVDEVIHRDNLVLMEKPSIGGQGIDK
jgi:glutamate 5-kinase